ncbi:hypothetical protein KBB27_04595 [Patescibacteria group bacterium]|nr:hypothetical protein [Patescibacteria group bacterium]
MASYRVEDWRFLLKNLHWIVISSGALCFLKVYLNNPADITPLFMLGLLIVGGLIYGILRYIVRIGAQQ